jgi:flagellin-like protein
MLKRGAGIKDDGRGASSLVATILLVLITISASGLIAGFVMPFIARAMELMNYA